MPASISSRLALLLGASLVLPSLAACLDHPLKDVEYDSIGIKPTNLPLAINKDVDILFVIDNSGSMGEEQATLAANFASFINVLEDPEVEANYRIGVTTTDNGNPWCGGTGPEAGALQLSSCRSRPQEFLFQGATELDKTQEACLDVCPEEWADIETIPTSIGADDAPRSRNWIENIEGATNLPEGLSTVQAFQCIGPQGISGCGFESPLESMYKAIKRSETDDDPDYGFIRDGAILSVVHVTDEADCSYNTAQESIFLPEGNRLFWSDQDAASPTSAVCWNAGVACDGDDCRPVDLDVDGNEVDEEDADELAVLRPVDRYVDILQRLEDEKKSINSEQEVLVALIGGVNGDGSVTYQDSISDAQFQADFGIGPGCQSEAGRAVPPVRLRELADAFAVGDDPNMFSICNSDYSDALGAIAKAIAQQVQPSCVPGCVADTDPTADGLDPQCVLVQEVPRGNGSFEETEVIECEADGSIPDGEDVCYVALMEDERSEECVAHGFNLEFRLERREGVYVAPGTGITASCQLSQNKAIECPDLP
ncbi:vWA domain-containing protein [Paraliomyxa miuraensis]|uniref:vWA domain-containing protein n=1 Tax=Paraliomyxa miuraensis TaxID=376150 RepID=UPI00224C91C0|nr:vWA domain-containing protein [Paraliomyxa miuraensis]MCX4247818.1 VWA domain-containing protein [Paraliomyxa miuraensis]